MRLDEGESITKTPTHSPSLEQFVVAENFRKLSDEAKAIQRAPQSDPSSPQDYFSIVTRATNDAVRDWNLKTGAVIWPQGLESLLGHGVSGADDISFWQKNLHPSDRLRIAASIQDALAGAADHWTGEYQFRRSDGSYINILERALILRDANGDAERIVGSLMDITARKQLQDQLCRSQRMEAFGQLAGGVAHDFNNFLTTILGYGDLLLHERQVKGVLADHITEIRSAATRASALTQQLLAFSRRQAIEPVVVEINSIVTNLERSLLRLLGENISVVCHLHQEQEGAYVKADPSQIAQIILNLAVNARDAMPTGGQLTIQTGVVELPNRPKSPLDSNECVPGHYVTISVTDTGAGMSEETKAHLFEPFFTTKTDENRSGLGLATCYGITHQSGGHLQVDSEQGKGTTVHIYLPRVPAPPPAAYKKRGVKKLSGGTETILILEDDISVRHLSVRMLRALGYEVIEAATGNDARQSLNENGGRKVDLLLTDLVMPQTSGRRFADALRSAHPNIKVLFISGYLEDSLPPADRCAPGTFFLAKPFDSEQLAAKVREALDS